MNDEKNFNDEPGVIIGLLKKEGLTDEANKIEGAYLGASTGNELISGVYFHLKKIKLNNVSQTTSKKIELYLKYLRGTYPHLC